MYWFAFSSFKYFATNIWMILTGIDRFQEIGPIIKELLQRSSELCWGDPIQFFEFFVEEDLELKPASYIISRIVTFGSASARSRFTSSQR